MTVCQNLGLHTFGIFVKPTVQPVSRQNRHKMYHSSPGRAGGHAVRHCTDRQSSKTRWVRPWLSSMVFYLGRAGDHAVRHCADRQSSKTRGVRPGRWTMGFIFSVRARPMLGTVMTVPQDHLPSAQMFRRIRTAPLFAQFFRLTKNPLVRQHPIASPGEKLSWKSPTAISMTEEECGRQCNDFGNVKTSTSVPTSW